MLDKRRARRSGLRLIRAAGAADVAEEAAATAAATAAAGAADTPDPEAGPEPDQQPEDLEELLRAKHGYQAAADAADAAKVPSLDDFVN